MPDAFVDTNILLYAVSNHPADKTKRQIAREILLTGDIAISFQILQEFYANAVHSWTFAFSSREAAELCQTWMMFPVCALDFDLFLSTLRLAIRYQISNWDAAVLAAAIHLGCSTLFSEDFQQDAKYDSVRVINPFV